MIIFQFQNATYMYNVCKTHVQTTKLQNFRSVLQNIWIVNLSTIYLFIALLNCRWKNKKTYFKKAFYGFGY